MYRRTTGSLPPKNGKGKLLLFCGNGKQVIIIYGGGEVIWKSVHHLCTSLIFCEAKFHTTIEYTKIIQNLRHILSYLSHTDL